MMRRQLSFFLVVLPLASGCGDLTGAPVLGPKVDERAPSMPVSERHISQCGSCHIRVEPGSLTRDVVASALSRHEKQRRLRMEHEEWKTMLDYLAPTPQASIPPR